MDFIRAFQDNDQMHPVPLGLYIHLPWCKSTCPYCDFNSHPSPDNFITNSRIYANALKREWQSRLPLVQGRQIQSVYCGGGTPNLIPPEWYAELFAALRLETDMAEDCEITLEANPGAGRIHDYTGYAQAGFTRISLGVQSFHGEVLSALGRDYSPAQAIKAIEQLVLAPVKSFNLDILFAAPQQNLTMLEADLATALSFSPCHLSCYELTIEPNTRFFSRPPVNLPDEDAKSDMYQCIQSALGSKELHRYEVSAYARKGHECRHNMNYWTFGDYLALGAGAHAKISFTDKRQLLRYVNSKNPAHYAAMLNFSELQLQPMGDWLFQFCLNAFRLTEGVSVQNAATRLFTTPQKLLDTFSGWIDTGEMLVEENRLRLAPHALLHQNTLLERLL